MVDLFLKENLSRLKLKSRNGDMTLTPTSCKGKIELCGEISLEMEHPIDKDGRWKYIVEDNIICIDTPWAKHQAFRIYKISFTSSAVKCSARHIVFDLNKIIKKIQLTGYAGQYALDKILEGTDFKSWFFATNSFHDFNYQYADEMSVFSMLMNTERDSFINRWNCEWLPDNHEIMFRNKIGSQENPMRLKCGKNVSSMETTIDTDDVVTRIIPMSSDGVLIGAGEAVDSPKIGAYAMPRMAVKKYEVSAQYVPQECIYSRNLLTLTHITTDILHCYPVGENYCCRYSVNSGDKIFVYSKVEKYHPYHYFLTDENNQVVYKYVSQNAMQSEWTGMYVYLEVPEGAKYLYFNCAGANEDLTGMPPDYPSPVYKLVNPDAELSGFEDVENELRRLALEDYSENHVDDPSVNVSVDLVELSRCKEYEEFTDFENISIGDLVIVELEHLGIDVESRVQSIEWDAITGRKEKCEVGNLKYNYMHSLGQRSYRNKVMANSQGLNAERASTMMQQYAEGNFPEGWR